MHDGPSRGEFEMLREMLAQSTARVETRMEQGFAGTHTRLDQLNGRIAKGEDRLGVLERQSYDCPLRRDYRTLTSVIPQSTTAGDSSLKALVKQQGTILAVGAVALVTLARVLETVLVQVWKLVTQHG